MGSRYTLSAKEKLTSEEDGHEQQVQNLNKTGKRHWIGAQGRLVVQIIAISLLLLVYSWFSPAAPIEHPRNPAYEVKAYRGAVASENELCSKIGIDVLRKGGNAVDAAISAVFCQGVVGIFSSGIGGGGFMVVRIPSSTNDTSRSEVWSLNFREPAPALANRTMFKDKPKGSQFGVLGVGVPGELRGMQEAHKRWGSLPWKELVEPSVELAKGWKMQKELAKRVSLLSSVMLNHPDWKPIFAPNGVLLKEGDWVKLTNYSRTLSIIAEQGADAFYEGPIADSVISKVRQTGGILSHEDLKNYRIRVEKPLEGTYRGRKIYTIPAPGAGPCET